VGECGGDSTAKQGLHADDAPPLGAALSRRNMARTATIKARSACPAALRTTRMSLNVPSLRTLKYQPATRDPVASLRL